MLVSCTMLVVQFLVAFSGLIKDFIYAFLCFEIGCFGQFVEVFVSDSCHYLLPSL